MTVFKRKARRVFKIAGPDAQTLLRDVFTAKMPENETGANWWALLSPQGKVQAEGLIGLHQGAFWLDVSHDIATKFSRRMGMYKLRANATIEDMSETHQAGWSGANCDLKGAISHKDTRHPDMGFRIISTNADTTGWSERENKAHANRVKLGICELGHDFQSDAVFPHDIAMDLLEGIDFAKGCYVGQEVVSRMRHRANIRRRPVIIKLERGNIGDEVMLGGKTVGTIGTVEDGHGVAIVRLDKISDPNQLEINGQNVVAQSPPWADYGFAGAPNPDKQV